MPLTIAEATKKLGMDAMLVAAMALGLAPTTVVAARASDSRPIAAHIDLAPALGRDGTFNGRAGVVGTVDAGAWTLVSDLRTGEAPRFAPATKAAVKPNAGGPWSAL